MIQSMLAGVIVIAALASTACATLTMLIHDDVDDTSLVRAVSGQEPVKKFRDEIDAFQKILWPYKEKEIEKFLGKPIDRSGKTYAMPVAQPRAFEMSGIRYSDEKRNKNHIAFYPVEDFAGIEVWYGIDGETPQVVLLHFTVDKSFPKLAEVKRNPAEKPDKPVKESAAKRKDTIDYDHYGKIKAGMSKDQVTEIFSAAAGDYAPGTDYFTRQSAWLSNHGATNHTQEWRSEKGRAVIEFDSGWNVTTAVFYHAGRDPTTNIDQRLAWDRERFDKVVKYVEKCRLAMAGARGL